MFFPSTSEAVLPLNELVSAGKCSAADREKASRQNATATTIWPLGYASPLPNTLFTLYFDTKSKSLEEAAQELANELHTEFSDSVAL